MREELSVPGVSGALMCRHDVVDPASALRRTPRFGSRARSLHDVVGLARKPGSAFGIDGSGQIWLGKMVATAPPGEVTSATAGSVRHVEAGPAAGSKQGDAVVCIGEEVGDVFASGLGRELVPPRRCSLMSWRPSIERILRWQRRLKERRWSWQRVDPKQHRQPCQIRPVEMGNEEGPTAAADC